MRSVRSKRDRRGQISIGLLAAGWIGIGSVGVVTRSQAQSQFQQLLPDLRKEVADQDRYFWTVEKIPPQPYMNEVFWPRYSADTPKFFSESLLQFVARTFYLTRENLDGSKSQAWAGGGWLAFRSGLIADMFGVQAAFYTSQPIFAPLDQGGTVLLAPPQNSIGVLGQIYGRVQIGDQEIRGGRQLVDTPLINPQDNRMLPNTFEAATLVSLPDRDRNYDYAVGYLWNMKQRDSNDFIPMSDALASNGSNGVVNRGAPFGMLKYQPVAGLSLVAMDYNVQDFINTAFAQLEYDFRQPIGAPNWIVGANVTNQRSVGANLLTGTPFQTYQASAKVQMLYSGWTLFVVGSMNGPGSNTISLFGGNPNYASMLQLTFDNANQKAVGGSIAYDLGTVGLSGLSIGAWYMHGWDAINTSTGLGIPDQNELDVWIQYRPTEGPLKGFRLRAQYANVWQQGNVRNTQPELQVVIDYTVLMRPPSPVR
ncbi:OprD family outer membrane porin [Bradyrhizobium sp. RDI18]|uniref:OprD family outer membrane porin n=1 Tax=Bradyrhizobium sp. RDI18 TaxID=3367400 RepID=UPI00371AAE29